MRGWLIVNPFLHTDKFSVHYKLLAEALPGLELLPGDRLSLPLSQHLSDRPDYCLFWDKDVLLARRLEAEGLPLFNSAFAVEACDNKGLTALLLQKAEIPAPRTILAPKTFEGIGYTNLSFLASAGEVLGWPMILKENFGSFGQQVYLAHSLTEAEAIVQTLGHKDFLLQEWIRETAGEDIRINVVGGKVIASMRRFSVTGDFRSNISRGGCAEPYTPSGEEAELAIRATAAVGADFAGVDVLRGSRGPLICEVNSNPHFKSTLDCTGVNLCTSIAAHIRRRMT